MRGVEHLQLRDRLAQLRLSLGLHQIHQRTGGIDEAARTTGMDAARRKIRHESGQPRVADAALAFVFGGGREGYFFALDSRSGSLLWKVNLGGQVNSGPMSYAVNGRQYIGVAAGQSLFSFALRQ